MTASDRECAVGSQRTLADAIACARTAAARLALLPIVIAACDAVRTNRHGLTPARIQLGATVAIDADAGPVTAAIAYMPPEQVGGEPSNDRADVYALGAILYHVLAGTPPFGARRATELIEDIMTAEPLPIELAAPATPRELASIVGKAMARDRAARYPNPRALADELVRFQAGTAVEAHAYTKADRTRRFLRRNRTTVLAAIVLIVAGGLGMALRSRDHGSAVTMSADSPLELH